MAELTKGDYVKFLKEFYVGTVVADLVYKNHPWLAIVPKNPEVRGNIYPKPVRYANITGQSATFTNAHDNQGPASRDRWECSHIDNYAKATVANKVIELSMGSPAAFREALTDAVDSAYSAFGNDVHFELLAKYPYGARAEVSSVTGAPTFALGGGEARFFEVGMLVQKTLTADHSVAPVVETQVVVAVDRVNDTITLDADFSTPLADGDRLYRDGDYAKKADALSSWLPGSAVTSALFNGIDRTVDPTRLAGVDASSGSADATAPLLDDLIKTGARLYREGSSPDICLLNPVTHGDLSFETEKRAARYVKVGATSGSLSFSALEIMTGAGAVPVVSDPAVAENAMYMGEKAAVELFSAGGLPRMFKKDGSFYHREETADNLAFYLFGFYNQLIQAPVKWAYTADITTA
jgi:hypothetical protein